ncbi:MAG: GWxTD domain-containing protein, partial [Thermoanaerobaculia bacterium]
MKTRNLLIAAVLVAAAATTAFAALTPAKADWGKGPVQYYMTNEEKAAWKALQTDADADAFIELFWARRDPSPSTPRNEFREEFEARVKSADDQLSHGRTRGSMTDPGRILILFGAPTRANRKTTPGNSQTGRVAGRAGSSIDPNAEVGSAMSSSGSADMVWSFEGDSASKLFGAPRVEMTFHDQYNNGEFKLMQPLVDMTAATNRVQTGALTQPGLTKAPAFPPAGAVAQKPATPPPPVTGVKTPALEAALADAKAGKGASHGAVLASAELLSPAGESFVPVQVYVPASAGVAADGADTIFGAVEDASGTRVTSFEEPAKLMPSRTDFFVDKTLALAPGKYTAVVGLAKAGVPVLETTGPIDVTGPS